MKKYTTLTLSMLSLFLLAGCSLTQDTTPDADDMNVPAETVTTDDSMDDANMMPEEAMMPQNDIVTTALNTPSLSTLVAALQAAELVTVLQGPGPFTVFAPDNAAFDALPDGTVTTLLEPANKDMLTKILTYHVVAGTFTAADLSDGMVIPTVQGQNLTVNITNGVVTLTSDTNNVVTVTAADLMQSNGVVHVVDNVLMPE
jgi:uncharacterized surface protein with fasciclin (FAS1) repeats